MRSAMISDQEGGSQVVAVALAYKTLITYALQADSQILVLCWPIVEWIRVIVWVHACLPAAVLPGRPT
jgi:hypothetical protein